MLMFAAHQGFVEAIEILIEYGADIEQRSSKNAYNALHYGLQEGSYSFKAVVKLLELGADPNALYPMGCLNIHPISVTFHSLAGTNNEASIAILKAFYKAKANFNHHSLEYIAHINPSRPDFSEVKVGKRTFLKLRDIYNKKYNSQNTKSEDNNLLDLDAQRAIQISDENSIEQSTADMLNIYPEEVVETENIPVLSLSNIESKESAIVDVLMIDENNDSMNKGSSSLRWNKMMTKAALGFKSVDFVVNMHKLISEPILDNAQLVLRDAIHFQSIIQGANIYSLSLSAIDIANLVSYGEYSQAIGEIIKTAIYIGLPMVMGEEFSTLYTATVMTYTGYKTAANLYSHYSNYGTPLSEFKSNIAYGKLFDYYGFEDYAKYCFLNAINIAKNQELCTEIQKMIAEERSLAGMLSYYEIDSSCYI